MASPLHALLLPRCLQTSLALLWGLPQQEIYCIGGHHGSRGREAIICSGTSKMRRDPEVRHRQGWANVKTLQVKPVFVHFFEKNPDNQRRAKKLVVTPPGLQPLFVSAASPQKFSRDLVEQKFPPIQREWQTIISEGICEFLCDATAFAPPPPHPSDRSSWCWCWWCSVTLGCN